MVLSENLIFAFCAGYYGSPAIEVDGSGNDRVRQFWDDGTRYEGDPRVDLGIRLARFVHAPEVKVAWL